MSRVGEAPTGEEVQGEGEKYMHVGAGKSLSLEQ